MKLPKLAINSPSWIMKIYYKKGEREKLKRAFIIAEQKEQRLEKKGERETQQKMTGKAC